MSEGRPTDSCECGDYRRDHKGGPCGFKDGCKSFRMIRRAPDLNELRTLAASGEKSTWIGGTTVEGRWSWLLWHHGYPSDTPLRRVCPKCNRPVVDLDLPPSDVPTCNPINTPDCWIVESERTEQ
jgi:hypothetical protein